jgi:hypothetical protein
MDARRSGRSLWISREAAAAGQHVADLARVPLEALVEYILFDLRDHAAVADQLPPAGPPGDRSVVLISEARRRGAVCRRTPAPTASWDSQSPSPAC